MQVLVDTGSSNFALAASPDPHISRYFNSSESVSSRPPHLPLLQQLSVSVVPTPTSPATSTALSQCRPDPHISRYFNSSQSVSSRPPHLPRLQQLSVSVVPTPTSPATSTALNVVLTHTSSTALSVVFV